MKNKYEIGPGGVEWASARVGQPVEEGSVHEIELTQQEEKALIAAGWLAEPSKKKEK